MHETMESAKKKKEGFLWTDLKAIWGNNLRRAFHELCFISHGLRVSKSLLIWIQPNSTFILSYHNRLTHYCRICTLHAMRTRQASAHKGRFLKDINISHGIHGWVAQTPPHTCSGRSGNVHKAIEVPSAMNTDQLPRSMSSEFQNL